MFKSKKPVRAFAAAVRRVMTGVLHRRLLFFCVASASAYAWPAQQTDPTAPVVVQPGAPGKPTKTLPPSTKGTLPPLSQADVEFMQGMIMHHAQAVEMTALL